jgi:MoxR-like ATPase
MSYAVRLARATRETIGLQRGAGPRASIALVRIARANALVDGRDFVLPDDIKNVALPVLRHRVQLSPELEIEGVSADSVISGLLETVPAPRQ